MPFGRQFTPRGHGRPILAICPCFYDRMRNAAAMVSLAVTALLAAPVALAHDGPHDHEGLPVWLWVALAVAAAAVAGIAYRALYRAARARDAAAEEEE